MKRDVEDLADVDGDAELLGELALQGGARIFAGLGLPARKLPTSGEVGATFAAREQNGAALEDDTRGNDDGAHAVLVAWGGMQRAWSCLAFVALVACAPDPRPSVLHVAEPVPAEVTVPHAATGPLAPSMVHADAGFGSRLADVDSCATCHADVASQWRKSAHAFASFDNPIYRVGVEKLRAERGNETSQFCGGCHDPALLVDGAMLAAIDPADVRAHAGITCATCHSIADAQPDGNASYDLDASPIPVPIDGDAEGRLRHRARVGRATLRTAAMCGTCHKAFLDPSTGTAAALVGQDDLSPWARSPSAGTASARIDEEVPQKDCRGCHMPRVPATDGDLGAKNGTVASHLFLGSHTWLAAMEGDAALVEKAQAFLKGRVSLDIGGTRPGPDGARIVDVVMRNLDVGHRFPGGVTDAQDTWLEVIVEDAAGHVVAEAGTEEASTGADPTAHVLTSYMARADGTRVEVRETHDFRAGVWNHTLAPRDAAVVGFAFSPSGPEPLRVRARLRHRSRNLPLQRAACAETRSARGVEAGKIGYARIDACKPQPITELAAAAMTLGASREPSFARSVAYGLGLSHALQEHLDDARAPYEDALRLATTPRQRAIALGGLAQLASRQGRVDETFALAARADAEAGAPTPAMQRVRAEVLAATWRLAEAAPLFLDVAERSPKDDAAWSAAAVAFGGAGNPSAALATARTGLTLQPRDADLLRVQAQSVPNADAEAAFLEHRTPDDAPSIRAQCSANVPGCANERIPVHVHVMRQAGRSP